MGSWNFFIELKVESTELNVLTNAYINSIYQKAFYFGISENTYNVGISSVMDNFLPANHLIYEFLSLIAYKEFSIRTNNIERIFDFKNKADFISFMYNTWEQKIDSTYQQFGVFLMPIDNYYKHRNKLYKKYYQKL